MITVVIPVSPIPSHPGAEILIETVQSVRHHLPDAEIILTFDGVRPEHEARRRDYEHFIRAALWDADHRYGNVLPIIFNEHLHQTGMMRNIIDRIDTPLIMYVEQDTPLVVDQPIDFPEILDFVTHGHSNMVRLHHEAVIPAAHAHMMHGTDGSFIRTSQWSQRPHIATTAFYRRVLTCFTGNAKSFIEDKMHGVVSEAFNVDGMHGWEQWRLHIYNSGDGNLKRSYHLDGRAGEPKLDDTQTF